jgi:hypothetical protein
MVACCVSARESDDAVPGKLFLGAVPPEEPIRPRSDGWNGSDQKTVWERTATEHRELPARVTGPPTVIRDHNVPRFTPVLPPFCGPKSERYELEA